MARIANNLTDLIGNTPLLRLNRVVEGLEADVLVKLEAFNPGGSVKDRIGYAMIKDAEEKGFLHKDSVIIEPTSGNTGIALAFVSAGQARATFIPRFASELGMKIAAVNTLELDHEILNEMEQVYNQIGDFEVHASDVQPFEQSHMLNRLKPELYTGCPFMGLYKREASNVRNHSYRSDITPTANQFMFRGVLNYGYVMQRALNNPSVCKTLARKTKRPYKQWWYDQKEIMAYAQK